jgi:hypothetical protein
MSGREIRFGPPLIWKTAAFVVDDYHAVFDLHSRAGPRAAVKNDALHPEHRAIDIPGEVPLPSYCCRGAKIGRRKPQTPEIGSGARSAVAKSSGSMVVSPGSIQKKRPLISLPCAGTTTT